MQKAVSPRLAFDAAAQLSKRLASLEGRVGDLIAALDRLTLSRTGTPPPPPPPPPPPRPKCRALVFYDFETSGIGMATANVRIHEVGAIPLVSPLDGLPSRPAVDGFREAVDPLVPMKSKRASSLSYAEDDNDPSGSPDTWKAVGARFCDWIEQCWPPHEVSEVVLAGFNSKRYDSRVLLFECQRHAVRLPRHLHFVDMRDVFKHFFPDLNTPPLDLNRYHRAAFDGLSIVSAHTALGDAVALRDITAAACPDDDDDAALWRAVDAEKETLGGVAKRCKIAQY